MSASSSTKPSGDKGNDDKDLIEVHGVLAVPLFTRDVPASTELHDIIRVCVGGDTIPKTTSPNLFLRLFPKGNFDILEHVSSLTFNLQATVDCTYFSFVKNVAVPWMELTFASVTHSSLSLRDLKPELDDKKCVKLLLYMQNEQESVIEQMASRLSKAELETLLLQEQIEASAGVGVKGRGKGRNKA
ncbi:hypothetical protein H0H87_012042, partial [Tephrocybe sp. NHM501043]